MDLIDQISKHLRIGKKDAERRVQKAHTDGNQIIYGGQARHDCDSKPVDDDKPILLTDAVPNPAQLLIEHRPLNEHQENVDFYLAGQPDGDDITFGEPEVDAIRKAAAEECLPVITSFLEHLDSFRDIPVDAARVAEAKAVQEEENRVLVINADYDNTFDIMHCFTIGCTKVKDGCCMAYRNPIVLNWFRHGESCPTGPQMFVSTAAKTKLNPLKASKRNSK